MSKKRLGLLASLILFLGNLSAQIVINEVFYNAPGVDTIEYIELYNNSGATVDLQGYNFSQGISYTFPSIVLGADEYLLVANDSLAMSNLLGVNALQWTLGGLNNSGEDIQLNNANGTMVDYIDYLEGGEWPAAADGQGYSMELCDPNKDNTNPAFWFASETNTGLELVFTTIYGTPGTPNTVSCPNVVTITGLTFNPANITIRVGETVEWVNPSTAISHNVNGSVATYPGNPEGFGNGAASTDWTFSHTFNIPGFYNYQCDPHVGSNMMGTVTVLEDQIVITEIMYNPPGVDELGEFIELYNKSNASINLAGYYFSEGFDYVFPDVSIASGEYLVIASDSSSIEALYGVTPRQWTLGGLTNGGELIVLNDPTGGIIDIVNYNNDSPWSEIANGEGPSLILCDPNTDNSEPSNWSHSINNTSIVPPGSTDIIFASPGEANVCPTEPQIFFNGISAVVNEGAMAGIFTVRMPILTATDSADVQVVLHPNSTATDVTDFTLISTTLHFAPDFPGEVSEAEIVIGIIDDIEIEGDETVVLQLMNAVGANIATPGLFTITIEDNDGFNYPTYPIGTVTTVDASEGIADSLDVTCSLTGIVHGLNIRPNFLQFTIIDGNNDGIGVFSNTSNFGYTVVEGDLVTIQGTIDQFNGLTQIVPDTLIHISSNNPLWFPDFPPALSENTESQMVRFNTMIIADPAQWTNSGSGFNVDITDGTNTVSMRIDADVDLYGTAPPIGFFDAIGIGGQFDFSAPFNEGYQFLPRYIPDIIPTNAPFLFTVNDQVSIDIDEVVTINVLANDAAPFDIITVTIVNQPGLGEVVVNGDFNITYTPDPGECGEDVFSYVACDNMSNCDTAMVTVNIECSSAFPLYEIGEVTTIDGDGLPDSLGVTCELRGIVYGVNLQSGIGGLQFTIIDPTDSEDGISVFSGATSGNLGYTVSEGDRITCLGEIDHFNGLAQINIDSISVLSTNNSLHNPAAVTDLGEFTESRLVKIFNVTLVDPSDWDPINNPSGFNVPVTDGTSTWVVRIDNDVDLYNEPAPTGTLNITGIGGQFDNAAPHDEGYQLFPRNIPDIEASIAVEKVDFKQQVHVFPNPVSNILFVNAEMILDRIQIYNELGQLVAERNSLSNNNKINIDNLQSGLYLLTFEKDGYRWTEKFIKQ